MKNKVIPNPILPAAGVRRNIAADGGASPPSGGQHDDRTPNQQGRVLSDHSTPSNALMRCRRPFVMGTFNPCTVREEARLVELAHCAGERGVEILGIQEHRRVHTDDRIVYRRVERCTFITASAWRNEAQAATGGVGLMLGPLARKALRRVYHHTDRILIAEFSGNPVTTVIVVYSPTNVAPSEEVEKFYEDLATAVRDVPAHNFLAILGDFNARLGPEDTPYPYHDSTNRNGAYLMALLMEHELLAANTTFRKRTGKRWTFQDRATGMLRQLDYILVRKKWRNSILNAEPYSTFSSVGSDHRMVSMRVRLSLSVPKPSPKIRHDWKAFTTDPGLQTRYTEVVRKRFRQLDKGAEPSSEYRRFVVANEEATRLCVPVLDRARTSLRSRHPEVVAARGRVEEARLNFEREPTLERRGVLNEAKQLLFSTYDTIKGEELMESVRRVQAAQGERQYGEAWRVINDWAEED
ncbi:craniofacial development protein 2-like [Trematomus bernacchii]|uniref:craniofacial development protein 2-like n=1 Tax=Trematomus bernacchii TaxID=40690 RepID=UPI00146CDDEE|nr:craniofacial development protein 2-like [Trematomus bernacchii]